MGNLRHAPKKPTKRALRLGRAPWRRGEESTWSKSSSALSCARSIQGDAGDADRVAPALVLGDDERSEILHRFRLWLAAKSDDLVPDFRCGKALIYDGIDLRDNV